MKAVVLQTRGREAAVLVGDGTVRVVRGRYQVGEVIDYARAVGPTLRQWAAAVAAMIALLGMSAGLWVDRNYIAYAEVSLDVNPSIVYTLNKRDRVLGVRAVNGDAQAVVERLEQSDIRFVALSDAVARTLDLLTDDGYLDAAVEDYVLVNVSADDENRQARLTEQVGTAMEAARERDATLEYRIDHSDRDTARKARDNGMSPGRYAAWQSDAEAAEEGPDAQAYASKPVRELLGHIPEAARGQDDTPAEQPSAGEMQERGQQPAATDRAIGDQPGEQAQKPAEAPQPDAQTQQDVPDAKQEDGRSSDVPEVRREEKASDAPETGREEEKASDVPEVKREEKTSDTPEVRREEKASDTSERRDKSEQAPKGNEAPEKRNSRSQAGNAKPSGGDRGGDHQDGSGGPGGGGPGPG